MILNFASKILVSFSFEKTTEVGLGTGADKPELVEQGAGLTTARFEPWTLTGWPGGQLRRFRLWPELPELPGAEAVAPRSTVIPTGGVGSRLTRDLLLDISPACFST